MGLWKCNLRKCIIAYIRFDLRERDVYCCTYLVACAPRRYRHKLLSSHILGKICRFIAVGLCEIESCTA